MSSETGVTGKGLTLQIGGMRAASLGLDKISVQTPGGGGRKPAPAFCGT